MGVKWNDFKIFTSPNSNTLVEIKRILTVELESIPEIQYINNNCHVIINWVHVFHTDHLQLNKQRQVPAKPLNKHVCQIYLCTRT